MAVAEHLNSELHQRELRSRTFGLCHRLKRIPGISKELTKPIPAREEGNRDRIQQLRRYNSGEHQVLNVERRTRGEGGELYSHLPIGLKFDS